MTRPKWPNSLTQFRLWFKRQLALTAEEAGPFLQVWTPAFRDMDMKHSGTHLRGSTGTQTRIQLITQHSDLEKCAGSSKQLHFFQFRSSQSKICDIWSCELETCTGRQMCSLNCEKFPSPHNHFPLPHSSLTTFTQVHSNLFHNNTCRLSNLS